MGEGEATDDAIAANEVERFPQVAEEEEGEDHVTEAVSSVRRRADVRCGERLHVEVRAEGLEAGISLGLSEFVLKAHGERR